MLQIQNICKKFVIGDLTQHALSHVSLNLRDNEFVAILGPSGSGKTTLLNIIGGLDRYDSGDLIINGISTQKYKDRDWDSYRNHTIGFVFQSYNLIPHQSVLANVELALTISGISHAERRKRAIEALTQVGLEKHLNKKPNQLSGGQMQRVAIARALINNPHILLADEPTGALDSDTSIQVMELLKEVAKKRLVVMVTHNPELAEVYATRIVRLRDGKIISDSNPYEISYHNAKAATHKNMGKASMSFLTSLLLSFHNLRTKKARTLLTAFAGSIGIIGIALILALSAGVNAYIEKIQRDTMSSYPVTIHERTIDLSGFLADTIHAHDETTENTTLSAVGISSNPFALEIASAMTTGITENNLTGFQDYLKNPENEIHKYVGENGIVYSYDTRFSVFSYDPEGVLVNTDGSNLTDASFSMDTFSMPVTDDLMGMMDGQVRTGFTQIIPDANNSLISPAVTNYYDVLYGSWPKEYNEIVLVVDKNNQIPAATLYQLGYLPASEYKEINEKITAGEEINLKSVHWNYEEICSKEFFLIPESHFYLENENATFDYVAEDMIEVEKLLEKSIPLKISGIVRPKEDASGIAIGETFGYTKALTDYIIEQTNTSPVVIAQYQNPDTNVVSGLAFSPKDDTEKLNDAKIYIGNLGITDKAMLAKSILTPLLSVSPEAAATFSALNESQLAAILEQYVMQNADPQILLGIYDNYISTGTYEENMDAFGVVSYDAPASISIYTDSFEDKDFIAACIQDYNKTVTETEQITYTDTVALLMSSVTTIINTISYVLIAFVGVSLVVSSIMIGIITYISVLERTKEIGILRALGASKHNISQVFNAETFIVGLSSGILGIGITLLLLIPGNILIHSVLDNQEVNAYLPAPAAVILVVLSVILTLIGGFIPSKKAAKKDPVTALRTE